MDSSNPESQQSDSSQREALGAFAKLMGLDPDLLADAYSTLKSAQSVAAEKVSEQKVKGVSTKKNYLDKELIYEDEFSFMYRRGDTKSLIWYFRMWDDQTKKPFIKSLGTRDHAKALVKARTIYQEIKGKISRGERLRTITSAELVQKYFDSLFITDVPHEGITPDTLRLQKYRMRVWLEFIESIGHTNTPIDRLPQDRLQHFGTWYREKPREDRRNVPRSHEMINNTINCVRYVYAKIGVRERYISADKVPDIIRLKVQRSGKYKRDILELDQYEKYWRFLEHKYIKEKNLKPLEKRTRILFSKFVGIMTNTGLRPKEFLTLRWSDISDYKSSNGTTDKKIVVIHIRAENAKTGVARNVVAPVKRRLEVIRKSLEDIGYEIKPHDFILMNPQKKDRRAYHYRMFVERLHATLEQSGLAEEIQVRDKKISLYSFRHQYIAWRLRYGGVPIHLIAKNCGTSIQKIEQTYGHIETEKQVDVITMNQGISRNAEVDLTTVVED